MCLFEALWPHVQGYFHPKNLTMTIFKTPLAETQFTVHYAWEGVPPKNKLAEQTAGSKFQKFR